jgi:pimeloyl-ACP methyl ester carboxylesterase
MLELILPDGRKLAYAKYGDPNGTPLLFLHGTPGTNLMTQLAEEGAKKHGFCLIAPDRPGLGNSDFQPHRRLYHYSQDIKALLDHLGIARCGIVAISGGAPYALQCAHDLPERIGCLALLSGWVSYGRKEVKDIPLSRQFTVYKAIMKYCSPALVLLGWVMVRTLKKHPQKLLDHIIADLGPEDQRILKEKRYYDIVLTDMQNAFRKGWKGPRQEAALQFATPGFRLEEIKQPTLLLHGTKDTVAPYAFAEVLRNHLPNIAGFRAVEGGGHLCAIEEQEWIYSSLKKLA